VKGRRYNTQCLLYAWCLRWRTKTLCCFVCVCVTKSYTLLSNDSLSHIHICSFFISIHDWDQILPLLKTNGRHIGILHPLSIFPSLACGTFFHHWFTNCHLNGTVYGRTMTSYRLSRWRLPYRNSTSATVLLMSLFKKVGNYVPHRTPMRYFKPHLYLP